MAQVPGFLQNLEYGVGTSTTASVGKVTGGTWGPNNSGADYDFSIGGIPSPKYGMVVPEGSCTFWPTSVGILASARRASFTTAAPPLLTFQGGNSREAFKHASAYIDTMGLECTAPDGKLTASLGWKAITPTVIAVPTWQEHDSGSEFHWFQGTCTLATQSCAMQSFKLDLNNNLTGRTSLDGGTTGFLRLAEEIVAGNEIITGNFTAAIPPSTEALSQAWADVPDATVEASLVFVNAASSPVTLTIALANMVMTNWSFNYVDSSGFSVYTIDYAAKPNTADSLSIS